MGNVKTNNVALGYAIETSLGVPGTEWFGLEPNTINTLGNDFTTTERAFISPNRQRRKGAITSITSAVEFEADITLSSFRDFIEGFVFANGINRDVTGLAGTAIAGTDGEFTLATALTAAQATKFGANALAWISDAGVASNNGLKLIEVAASATDTELDFDGALTDETNANLRVSFAGHRISGSTNVTWAYDSASSRATLTSATIGTTLGNRGLTVGQVVHIGSVPSPNSTVSNIVNGFQNTTANDMVGYARVREIATGTITFDKLSPALQFSDSTSPTTPVDIVFGEFIRNVATADDQFIQRSYQFEGTYPGLAEDNSTEYLYAIGNFCNTVSFNLPLTDKATSTFGFVGTDTEDAVAEANRKTGADSTQNPRDTVIFNTSTDIARLRIQDVDEDGLSTDFKSLTLTINNNVTPENVLAQLAAADINYGNFDVQVEAQLLFSNSEIINRIRRNETVTLDFILNNDDGVIAVDIPSVTLGGGTIEYPVNETVLINTTSTAFEDDLLGTSIGVSILPVPIPSATN